MKKLKTELKAVIRELKALTRKAEQIGNKVAKLEKAQAAKKTKAKAKPKAKKAAVRKETTTRAASKKKAPARKKTAPKKPKRTSVTATDQVLRLIAGTKKGIDVPTLMKKTRFDEKKVRNIISRAFKMKKIKRPGRGIYVAAK